MANLGRPSIYSEEMVAKAKQYLLDCEDEPVQEVSGQGANGTEFYRNKLNVKLPTIEGLAYYLKIHKDTIYDWENKYPDFSDVISELRAKQAQELVNKGLSGDYNSTIAKVLLTKHGYREGADLTTNGTALPTPIYGHKSISGHHGDEKGIPTPKED